MLYVCSVVYRKSNSTKGFDYSHVVSTNCCLVLFFFNFSFSKDTFHKDVLHGIYK